MDLESKSPDFGVGNPTSGDVGLHLGCQLRKS